MCEKYGWLIDRKILKLLSDFTCKITGRHKCHNRVMIIVNTTEDKILNYVRLTTAATTTNAERNQYAQLHSWKSSEGTLILNTSSLQEDFKENSCIILNENVSSSEDRFDFGEEDNWMRPRNEKTFLALINQS
uniref:Uncharacterized protein n=1 Tax=Wuchereria bancrofti TaxID=6293 RepID=A0AAF5PJL7_WUCBA